MGQNVRRVHAVGHTFSANELFCSYDIKVCFWLSTSDLSLLTSDLCFVAFVMCLSICGFLFFTCDLAHKTRQRNTNYVLQQLSQTANIAAQNLFHDRQSYGCGV